MSVPANLYVKGDVMSRSSGFKRQADTDETFSRAAWDTCKDLEIAYRAHVLWEIDLDSQKGVWRLRVRAESRVVGERGRQLACTSGEYPNSRAGTMSAYLFALANTLSQMVSSVRAEDDRNGVGRA